MIGYTDAVLHSAAVHRIGNPVREEPLLLSDRLLETGDPALQALMLQYCLAPLNKLHELYYFQDPDDHPLFGFASAVFSEPSQLLEISRRMAEYLYNRTDHAAVKEGELYIILFKRLLVNGEEQQALGIFKSESKEPFLTLRRDEQHYVLGYEPEGINLQRLDKGCLILNTAKTEGFRVLVLDHTNRSAAQFWTDRFLKVMVVNDHYQQTQAVMGAYRRFVTEEIADQYQMEKPDQIDLLNRSMHYFKEKDHFNLEEFSKEVIGNEQGAALFKEYKTRYEEEHALPPAETFDIHPEAVKKQTRVYKSVLKLDRNFHIYIHGNREYIEKGFDAGKNLHYYKVYFRDEQ
jgi:hypothetical protein